MIAHATYVEILMTRPNETDKGSPNRKSVHTLVNDMDTKHTEQFAVVECRRGAPDVGRCSTAGRLPTTGRPMISRLGSARYRFLPRVR